MHTVNVKKYRNWSNKGFSRFKSSLQKLQNIIFFFKKCYISYMCHFRDKIVNFETKMVILEAKILLFETKIVIFDTKI